MAARQSDLIDQRYVVENIATPLLNPSPENDDIYGEIEHDEQMDRLIDSIRRRGLEDPLIVSEDHYIISGHRRYFACRELDIDMIPCRVKRGIFREGNDDWHKLLAEYNPQRVKSAGTIIKEALLRMNDTDGGEVLEKYDADAVATDVDYQAVAGVKDVDEIGERQTEFLNAVQLVVNSLRRFWPLSIRQIHYNLLNNPPLRQTIKSKKRDAERWRYRNDDSSYTALSNLLTPARYQGLISFEAIDDATRPKFTRSGYKSASEFINSEVNCFLRGFNLDVQLDQPRHIEVLGEKNTLKTIIEPVCYRYYVPLTLGRGYAGPSVWREISRRFRNTGKKRMTLIIISDYDPEGFDLADDAVRSLRDLWNLPVDYHRVGVNREQIESLGLASDFNPAKIKSTRLKSFIKRTGGRATWEVEALPPDYLRQELENAILANMDRELFEATTRRAEQAASEIKEFRRQVIESIGI